MRRESGHVYISGITPGPGIAIDLRNAGGHRTGIVLLSRDEARDLWEAPLAGRERLVLSPADVYFEGGRIHLSAADPASLIFGVFPALSNEVRGFHRAGLGGIFERYTTTVKPIAVEATVSQSAEAGPAAPVRMGKEVAMAPEEADFGTAARWSIRVPEIKADAVGEIILRITYQGDVARLYAGKRLITDDFYHGAPWEIGLRDIPAAERERGLELQILPLRQDAPIYLAKGAWPSPSRQGASAANRGRDARVAEFHSAGISGKGQTARLIDVKVVPYYRVTAELSR